MSFWAAMVPEDGDRITFRLSEDQKKDIQDGLKKNLLEGSGNYPIPSDRPMLVHRGFWKQSKEREDTESEANAEGAQDHGGEAEGYQFFGAQITQVGPPTPPPLPPPPPPLSARGGALSLQRWNRPSPLSSTRTPAAAAAVGSGGAAQVSNNPGLRGMPLSTAGVDTSALNRQQAAEFFNSRVGREANGSLWRTAGHLRRPSQPGAARQSSFDTSIPPVLRRIRNRSNRGRRLGQHQQPHQSNMLPPPSPPALPRQETSTNLFQRRRSQSGNVTNAAVPSNNNAPSSSSTNNGDEQHDDRPIFGLANDENTEFNFFFSSTVPLTSAFEDADDEATSRRRNGRNGRTQDERSPPPTAGARHVPVPVRHTTASLLDWASAVISTATAPRNASGFFSNSSTAAAPFSGYNHSRPGEQQAPTGGLSTNRSPARRRRGVGTMSPTLPHSSDSSAAEYLGMDVSSPMAQLSRRSSPLFEPISRGSINSEQDHN